MSSSKFPKSSYSKIPPELLTRYAKQLVDDLPSPHLDMGCRYDWQVRQAISHLRYDTVRSYREMLDSGIECDMFMYYLHNFSLAEDSPLYDAVVGEIKVRKLARIL